MKFWPLLNSASIMSYIFREVYSDSHYYLVISNIQSFRTLFECQSVFGLIQHIICIWVCFYVVSLCFLKTDCVQYVSNLMTGTFRFHNHIIELVVLSNNSSWRSKGIWRLFIRLYKRCSAFFAWSTLCLIALKKVRWFVKTVPKYLNSSQMSIVSSPNLNSKLFVFRMPNIRTFDLLRLMFSFQSLEYSKKTLIFSWNDFGSVPNITVSSAYKSVKILRYTSQSFSGIFRLIPNRLKTDWKGQETHFRLVWHPSSY